MNGRIRFIIVLFALALGWTIFPNIPSALAANPAPSALLQVDPPGDDIDGSTYNGGSFIIKNTSTDGSKITKVKYDFSTGILPKIIFDPDGTGGDKVAKAFTPNSSGSTVGLQSHAFSKPYNAQNQGYYALEVNFNNFDPNETFTFSVDVDPANIRGSESPGPGESGSVSGLEVVGATVTVTFSNGSTYTVDLYRMPNSVDGSQNTVSSSSQNTAKPSVQVLNLQTPAIVRNPNRTVRVNGPVGANVALLILEAARYTPLCGGCTPSTYEVNSAASVTEFTGTIGANGRIDFNVTLKRSNDSAGYNYLTAVVKNADGVTGPTADPVIVKYDPNAQENTKPDAVDDSFTTNEDTVLNQNVTTNDTDADGDTLTATVTSQPKHGTLTFNANGSFTYTPSANYHGSDSFNYTVNDGHGGSDTAIVSITVQPVNDAPQAQDDAYTAYEGTTLHIDKASGVLANDTDIDDAHSVLSAEMSSLPLNMSVVMQPNGAFTVTPNAGFTGSDSFEYTVSDDGGGSDKGVVVIEVVPVVGPSERLINGTFEAKSPALARLPASWNSLGLGLDRIKCNKVNRPGKPDKIFAYEGSCAFRFIGEAGENSQIAQKVPIAGLNPNDTLYFSAYVRGTAVIKGKARIVIRATYSDQPPTKQVIKLPAGTYPYTQISDTLQLTGQLTKLRVRIQYKGSTGNFFIDMASLYTD